MIPLLLCGFLYSGEADWVSAWGLSLRKGLEHVKYDAKHLEANLEDQYQKPQKGAKTRISSLHCTKSLGPSPMLSACIHLERSDVEDGETAGFSFVNVILWPTIRGTGVQILDRFPGDQPLEKNYFTWCEAYRSGDRMIRCGAATDYGNRSWPAARTYRLRQGHWVVISNQGVSSPFGQARFSVKHGQVDPTTIHARIRVSPKHMGAAMSGPFLTYRQNWRVVGDRIVSRKWKMVENPIAVLDRLAGFSQKNQRRLFDCEVYPRVRRDLWRELRAGVHVSRMHNADDELTATSFALENSNGSKRMFIAFENHGGRWTVSRIYFGRPTAVARS